MSWVWHLTESNCEALVQEIWGVNWPGVVVSEKVPSIGQIDLYKKLFVFDRNTWCYIIICIKNTNLKYYWLQRINISFLTIYVCTRLLLDINNPYNCANKWLSLDMILWLQIIIYKELIENPWNHTTVCKLFVLNCVSKSLKEQHHHQM